MLPLYSEAAHIRVCVCTVVWVRDNWDQVVINRENPVGDDP